MRLVLNSFCLPTSTVVYLRDYVTTVPHAYTMSAFIVRSWITNREITLFTHNAVYKNFVVLFLLKKKCWRHLYSMLTASIARPELFWYSLCWQFKAETSKIDSWFPINVRMKKRKYLPTTNGLLHIRVHVQNTRLSKRGFYYIIIVNMHFSSNLYLHL